MKLSILLLDSYKFLKSKIKACKALKALQAG